MSRPANFLRAASSPARVLLPRQAPRPLATSPACRRSFAAAPRAAQRVSDAIKQDHRELESYHARITSGSADADEKARFQNLFVWELARHSVAEELVVYPALEARVKPDGAALAKKDRAEHQRVKEQLYDFQAMTPSDAQFGATLGALYTELQQHIREEEEHDLPELEKALGADESAALARSFARTKRFVPTRSHPSAPDKPPFETVVGLMSAPIDKLMDLFKKFPDEEEKKKAEE